MYLYDKDKLERFNTLNQSLVQVENCKEIAKWIMKNLASALKLNVEPSKIAKYFQSTLGLDEAKANLIREMVIFLNLDLMQYIYFL